MFLIYVDESGEISNTTERIFVLGSIAVYENKAFYLSQEFDKIQEKWFPNLTDPIEFHASKIFNGNGEPWHSLTKDHRRAILLELCDAIVSISPKGLSLFGVVIEKGSSNNNIIEKAFYELCGHIDAFISGWNINSKDKSKDRGLLILDSSKYHGQLDKLLLTYRKMGGTKFGRIKNFADAPAFANSNTTRLLQAADIVSYAIQRRYERADALYLDKLLPRFQEKDGIIHGLVHLPIGDRLKCLCPACISRRNS